MLKILGSRKMFGSRLLPVMLVATVTLAGCASWPDPFGPGNANQPLQSANQTMPQAQSESAKQPEEVSPAGQGASQSTEAVATPVAEPAKVEAIETAPEARPEPKAEPKTATKAAPKALAKTSTKAKEKTKEKTKPEAKPEMKAEAGSKAKPTRKESSSVTLVSGYYINVGLFAVQSNANNVYKALEKAGLPVFSDGIKSKKGALTRVRVGPYTTEEKAAEAAQKIMSLKFDAVVFKN